jgi:hypothetical protein
MGPARRSIWEQCFLERLFPLALGVLGCSPEIGDECGTSIDCSPAGDRICDVTQPGGYCTIYNCEDTTEDESDAPQGACPEEAACVVFGATPSAICGGVDGNAPYQRTFCMFRCENNTDCRTDEGYRCLDLSDPAKWAAVVIDRRSADERKSEGPIKVCSLPYDGLDVTNSGRSSDVCTGTSRSSEPAE